MNVAPIDVGGGGGSTGGEDDDSVPFDPTPDELKDLDSSTLILIVGGLLLLAGLFGGDR